MCQVLRPSKIGSRSCPYRSQNVDVHFIVNLRVPFYTELNSHSHVNNICKSDFSHVRNRSSIRNMLDEDSVSMAAHALFISTLDYSNSSLYGLPKTKIHKLQLVQNAAARVFIIAKRSDRISMIAVRQYLHRQPINARIEFKKFDVSLESI